jgi:hypothetical protein
VDRVVADLRFYTVDRFRVLQPAGRHVTDGDIADHKHLINENINFRITKNVDQTLAKQAVKNSANV